MEIHGKNKDGAGIVYILTNEAMPGYVKIGKTTTSVEQRMLELYRTTAVPLPFECYYAARVANMSEVEEALHDAFGDHRVNPRREFFSIAPERVVAVLRLLTIEEVTPSRTAGVESKEDVIALEKARKRRSAFNFKMLDIPAGAELKFIRDEKITCVVASDQKHVIFNNKEMSSSEAAAQVLKSKWWPAGSDYWTYDDEILSERRIRLEESEPTEEEIKAAEDAGDAWIENQIEQEKGK